MAGAARTRPPHNEIEVFPLPSDIVMERDVGVMMADGIRLSANVFRPRGDGSWPVVLALTPYGKDEDPGQTRAQSLARRAAIGLGMGRYRVSSCTPFEAPDPAYWVPHGYVVVHVDLRGCFKSQGERKVFSRAEIKDYSAIIDWAGTQAWSTGKVALHGVSYLAICQWHAAVNPSPHLAAIVPWEGASDSYRDVRFHGGVPETAFHRAWSSKMGAAPPEQAGPSRTPTVTSLRDNRADLAAIQVPALICGSFSDQGLHTKGCFDAFMRIGSEHKWLYTHGRGKWTVYYEDDALAYQRQFLDHFLKGADNGMLARPRVRLEVRENVDAYATREEADWPLPRTEYRELYLDGAQAALTDSEPSLPSSVSYDAIGGASVSFDHRFSAPCEITGHMRLKLWVSTDSGDDMDLFVAIKKLDAVGDEVCFEGRENDPRGPVSLGWLRVSHRELDELRSRPFQPVLTHEHVQLIEPGQIVPVEIEILPSSTSFAAGETLRLVISGEDIFSHAMLHHRERCNQGTHTLHIGGEHDARLLVPFVQH